MRSTILFVPGLRDHVADHWQTLLAEEIPGARTVAPLERDKLSCGARVAALDAAIAAIPGPVTLVAHSAGCLIVAHWAQRCHRPIRGAFLATPADIERPLPPGYPSVDALLAGGWLPLPRTTLPFPCIVGLSSNDPLARLDRMMALGGDWGADVALLGDVGHLNPAAGFGPWPAALDYIEALQAHTHWADLVPALDADRGH